MRSAVAHVRGEERAKAGRDALLAWMIEPHRRDLAAHRLLLASSLDRYLRILLRGEREASRRAYAAPLECCGNLLDRVSSCAERVNDRSERLHACPVTCSRSYKR